MGELDSTVFSGLGEGKGGRWHWALRPQLLPGSLQVSYLLGNLTLAGGAIGAMAQGHKG